MKNLALILMSVIAIHLGSPRVTSGLDRFKMIDLQVDGQRMTGRVLNSDGDLCWFLQRNGRLQRFATNNVTNFKEVADRFRAHSCQEIKKQLESEFGKDFEVRTTSHYVVAARRGCAESYAILFERIYFEFMRLFRARGLHVFEAEFPLVAIVFPDETSFIKYCRDEKTQIQPGLVGYYLSSSNRVAMYERPNAINLDTTVIHEATHQVAFNTGVHSRIAKHPRWVVEGLATTFEADGIRSRVGTLTPADRINPERYHWFLEYINSRRKVGSLNAFIRDDNLFQSSTLDAYSEAWALSFFLMETKPKEYATYLKKLVDREPLAAYDSEQRIQEFEEVFGRDIDRIESSYLWFMRKIAKR